MIGNADCMDALYINRTNFPALRLCHDERVRRLAPGERGTLPIMSASLWQANKALQYLSGIFSTVPALKTLVSGQTADTLSL
jgi:hypothetical protein